MNLLPFGHLPMYAPRRFVPSDLNAGDWAQIAPQFDRLESQVGACQTVPDLERWICDWGELCAALDEEGAKRYIAMTCHTDNAEAEKAYLHFVEHIDPQIKPRQFQLARLYAAHPLRPKLPRKQYEVLDRDLQVTVELFRDENVPLETEETKLGQQYQKLAGSLTVQFRGEEKTLVQMARYVEEPDRALRQEAWELVANRRLQEAGKFEDNFDQQLNLRQQTAAHADFPNYLEYAFRQKRRFDYTPADCVKFHDAIEQEFMPLLRELQSRRRRQLGLSSLRPWDLAVDPLNLAPLRPFETVEQLVAGAQRIFDRLDGSLGAGFQTMRELHLLDLDNHKGKAPGGYQSTLAEARLPFIFMNAVGVQRDVETLLHEGGHAFHTLACRADPLYTYRTNLPIEFCEVASMSMELLGNEFAEEFYSAPDSNRARRDHLELVVKILPWVATIDAFQHWIYTHSGHSRKERTAAWLKLVDRFGDDVDWTGFERVRDNLWHRQPHLFVHPLYYVEYGLAQLGAVQVWANFKRDNAGALKSYQQALALGGSRPLPELFAAAGCRFDFSSSTIKPLVKLLRDELAKLG
jgi:oligoendopeptidase F